jgi:putative membrane protein
LAGRSARIPSTKPFYGHVRIPNELVVLPDHYRPGNPDIYFWTVPAMIIMLLLHAGAAIEPHDFWSAWELDPAIVITVVIAGLMYLAGASRMGRGIRRPQSIAFGLGWLSLVIALISPLHALGGALFSAHMLQHEILMLLAAPLILLGRPAAVFLWAFPMKWRVGMGRATRTRVLSGVWRFLSNPWFAWGSHAAALWVWHIPILFQATLKSEPVHFFQHFTFFISALLFWWVLLKGGEAAMSYGAGVLYLFTTGVHSGVLGALLTFARLEWYPAYKDTAAAWGFTALEDQQLAGLIMWVPAGLVYMAGGLVLFAVWLKRSDHSLQMCRISGVLALLFCLFLAGCQDKRVAQAAAEMTGGDPAKGHAVIRQYGCPSCHTIPGIAGANGLVGPPLNRIGSRAYIAGVLPNNPGNMMSWLRDPRHIDQQTAMPKEVVQESDIKDIAAYLYTLQ